MSDSNLPEFPSILPDPELAARDIGPPPAMPSATGSGDEPRHQQERQQAFDAEFAWRGERLHPWSSSRDALFTQHRVAMGAPPLDACLQDVDAFALDAHRILWIASHTPEDWGVLRVSPTELQGAIDAWADDHIAVRETLAASTLAMRIFTAARMNQHEAAPTTGKPHGDDSGN